MLLSVSVRVCLWQIELLDKALGIFKSLCGDLCESGKGVIFAVPLSFVDGLPDEA